MACTVRYSYDIYYQSVSLLVHLVFRRFAHKLQVIAVGGVFMFVDLNAYYLVHIIVRIYS